MPRPKPSAITGTAELNATIERVAPAILELLADGVPRTKAAIVEALAGRHDAEDVALALIRLAVTGRVEERAGSTRRRRPAWAPERIRAGGVLPGGGARRPVACPGAPAARRGASWRRSRRCSRVEWRTKRGWAMSAAKGRPCA